MLRLVPALLLLAACATEVRELRADGTPREDRAPARRDYDLPAGDAAETLTRFATASGEQIVYLVDNVRGERTRAVSGKYSAREALEHMLAGTALVMARDPVTGAFFVGRRRASAHFTLPFNPVSP
jgi:hypothetical protein